jgi:hypothetical protein
MSKYDLALSVALSISWLGTVSSTSADQDTYTPTTTQPVEEASPPTSAPAKEAELPGPKYMALRYNDDFSYLDGEPGSYMPDFFDPIKYIHLGQDWRLSLGGEIRERMESDTNRNFGSSDPTQDTFLLHRTILHADVMYQKLFRVYAEGIDATVFDRDLPQSPNQENRFDVNQAFFDFRILGQDQPFTLRFGRQEMAYGRERVIGRSDWSNATRRFDGVKLMYSTPKLDVDVFYMKPIVFANAPYRAPLSPRIYEGLNRKPDKYRHEQNFYGLYSTYKGIKDHALELYFLGLQDDDGDHTIANVNGQVGNLKVLTWGGRFSGASGGFDYDIESAAQSGQFAGDDIHAWMAATDDGYTWTSAPWQPRLGVGFDYARGDRTPRDNSVQNYFQLFPTGHSVLGYIDLVGRQNIIAPNVNLTFKPLKNLTTRLFYYHFWLDSNLDALYNASGTPGRRNISGSSGNDVGDEFDITLKYDVDAHSSFLFGYSHFWPKSFIETTGRSRDPDFLYLQYCFKF